MTIRKLKIGVSKLFNSKVILIWDTLVKLPNGGFVLSTYEIGFIVLPHVFKRLMVGMFKI
jgi:hypothetical protein